MVTAKGGGKAAALPPRPPPAWGPRPKYPQTPAVAHVVQSLPHSLFLLNPSFYFAPKQTNELCLCNY